MLIERIRANSATIIYLCKYKHPEFGALPLLVLRNISHALHYTHTALLTSLPPWSRLDQSGACSTLIWTTPTQTNAVRLPSHTQVNCQCLMHHPATQLLQCLQVYLSIYPMCIRVQKNTESVAKQVSFHRRAKSLLSWQYFWSLYSAESRIRSLRRKLRYTRQEVGTW